ncbi:MAG: hypothetical protein ACRDRL_31525 [Sciscionella sp.]
MTSTGAAGTATKSTVHQLLAVLRWLVGCALVGVVLAFLGGWLWVRLGNPPQAPVVSGGASVGASLGELQISELAKTTVWFLVIGAVLGALAGLAVGWLGRRRGVWAVFGLLALCGAATVLSWVFGQYLFGADLDAQLQHAAVGSMVRLGVSLGTPVAYLGWPIGGLAGVLAAAFFWSGPGDRPPATTATAGPPAHGAGTKTSGEADS